MTVCLFEEGGLRLRLSSRAKEWGLFVCGLWPVEEIVRVLCVTCSEATRAAQAFGF